MPDEYHPKPFTDAQRKLFTTVAKLNREKRGDFAEADEWIDALPPTARQEYVRWRSFQLELATERRIQRDRSHHIALTRQEMGRGVVTYHRRAWERMPDDQKLQLLRDFRTRHAEELRYQRRERADDIREEDRRGPLKPCERIELKARRFIHMDEPLVFDAMNPQQKALWARRLLRLVWVLTDTADLTCTSVPWLRDWKWGEHSLEYLAEQEDGNFRPIPRLWSRVTLLERDVDEWEKLTKEALQALEELEATSSAQITPARIVAQTEPAPRSKQKRRRGRLSKDESEAKRATLLAILHQHPSLKDDPAKLAADLEVSESTVRRWMDQEEQKYRESKALRPPTAEERMNEK